MYMSARNTHLHSHVIDSFEITRNAFFEIRNHQIKASSGKCLGDDGLGIAVRDEILPGDLYGVGGKRIERVGE